MKETDGGRYCNNCQKTVVDFSGLSNKEVYDYFSSANLVPCGRFHSSQLNTILIAEKVPSRPWKKFYRSAAALLAFFTLKNATVSAQTKAPTTVQPTQKKTVFDLTAQTITIRGTVKDGYGAALQNAEINFDNKPVAKADSSGSFRFDATIESSSKTSLLTVNYPGLNTVVRSYHPAMHTASYKIVLEAPKRLEHGFRMGMPLFSSSFMPQSFEQPVEKMTSDFRMRLAAMADTFRNNPNVRILISAYGTKPKEIRAAKNLLAAVKTYFVEKEGISEDRLYTKVKPIQKGAERRFDIEPYEPE